MASNKSKQNPDADDPFDDWNPAEGETASDEMPSSVGGERPPFLKPHDLRLDRGTLELVRVTTETSEYSDVVLLVAVGTRNFRFGMKLFSPDYKRLLARFGSKKEAWKGELQYKVMPHKGNPRGYVAVR
jgi:hypothetical protein